jgi:integrase
VKTSLTQAFVQSLEAANVDVYDMQRPGLVLRTRSSGKHSYRVLLKHGQWYTLGSSTVLTPAAARDEERRRGRMSANEWRRERGYELMPEFGTYTDHLSPIVLLAIDTGLRRGELLPLNWDDVDLERAILTVRGEGAKSGRTRHVPLNAEAVWVLREWQGPTRSGLSFPGEDGQQMTHLKSTWTRVAKVAKLRAFRFHDLRHTFASKLVQRGVDLNTVRELLGHSDFSLTLRYAHLAAENKAAAVATLMDAHTEPVAPAQPIARASSA